MDGRAASQTITDKMPFLFKSGWDLHIFSAVTGVLDNQYPHHQLLPWGPSGLRFDLRHYVRNRWGRNVITSLALSLSSIALLPFIFIEKFIIGLSSQWSWAIPVFIHGIVYVKKNRINLIYSTGGAWSAHLAGYLIAKSTGVRWIAEIHDPLVAVDTDMGCREAFILRWLERKICEYAYLAWWFTDKALDKVKDRNHIVQANLASIIPGADPPEVVSHHRYSDQINFAYFGILSESRTLKNFLLAMQKFLTVNPEKRGAIALHIYGGDLDATSKKIIEEHELSNLVTAHGRLEFDKVTRLSGRDQIIQKMHEADILLLLHGSHEGCAEYIPSKTYEYFWAKRPILGMVHNNPQLCHLLEERGHWNVPENSLNDIYESIEQIYQKWSDRQLFVSDPQAISTEDAVKQILSKLRG